MSIYCNFTKEEALERELSQALFWLKTGQINALVQSLDVMLEWVNGMKI